MANRFIPARDAGVPGSTATGAPAAYEFSQDDNSVFSGLATAMAFVGIISMVFGALQALGAITANNFFTTLVALVSGGVLVIVGAWLTSAAGSLRAIVTTAGYDIDNLMTAMKKLRAVYRVQAALMTLVCVLVLIAVLRASRVL